MRLSVPTSLIVLLLLASSNPAADRPDYSGSYTLTGAKGGLKYDKNTVWTLKVLQLETAIEVARVMDGKANLNKFPLDGKEGCLHKFGGDRGQVQSSIQGKNLILDSFVTTHPRSNGPGVQMHTKERGELSSGSKVLTIHSDVDFPSMPVNPVDPWSEIYVRN